MSAERQSIATDVCPTCGERPPQVRIDALVRSRKVAERRVNELEKMLEEARAAFVALAAKYG